MELAMMGFVRIAVICFGHIILQYSLGTALYVPGCSDHFLICIKGAQFL